MHDPRDDHATTDNDGSANHDDGSADHHRDGSTNHDDGSANHHHAGTDHDGGADHHHDHHDESLVTGRQRRHAVLTRLPVIDASELWQRCDGIGDGE
ncbi:MAG: hypothetical protein WBW04_02055 [Nitrolancea sp.]